MHVTRDDVETEQVDARFGKESTDFPSLFIAADSASVAGRRSYVRLVKLDLTLLLAGAALSAVAPEFPDTWADVVRAGSVALLVAGFIAKSANRVRRFDSEWFDGRAVAESVKTMTWRFVMRVPPFDGVAREAERHFLTDLREILRVRSQLVLDLGAAADTTQITAGMRRVRELSLSDRRQVYLRDRVDNQIQWYANRAEACRNAASRWFWVGLTAQILAIAVTILRIVVTGGPDIVALFAAVAAVSTAWTQLGRNDELSKSYALAAQELILLKSAVEAADDEPSFQEAVADAESAVSREHTLWVAKQR